MADNEFQFKISSAFLFAENILTNPTPMDPGVIFENGRFNKYYFKRNFDFENNVQVEDYQDEHSFSYDQLVSRGTGIEYLQDGKTVHFIDSDEWHVNPPLFINSEGNLEFTMSASDDTGQQSGYFLPMNNLNMDYSYIRLKYKVTYGENISYDDAPNMGLTQMYTYGDGTGSFDNYLFNSDSRPFYKAVDQGWVQDECYIAYYQTYIDPDSGNRKYRYVPMNFDFLAFDFSDIYDLDYDVKIEINKIWCWNPPPAEPFNLDWWYNSPDDVPDIQIDEYTFPYVDGNGIYGEGKLPDKFKDLTNDIPYYWLDGADCSSSLPQTWFRDISFTIPLYTLSEELSSNYKIIVQFTFNWASEYIPEYNRSGSLGGTLFIKLVNSNDEVLHYTSGSFGFWDPIEYSFTFKIFGGADCFYDYYHDVESNMMYICGIVSYDNYNYYGGATFPLSKLTEYNVKLGADWFTPVAKSNIYFATGAYDPLNVPEHFNFETNMIEDSSSDPQYTINNQYLSDVDDGTSFHFTDSYYELGDTVTVDPTYDAIRIRHWYGGTSTEGRYTEVYQYLLTPILNIYRRYQYINIRYIIVTDSYGGDGYYPSNVKFRFYGRYTDNNPPTVYELDYYYECTDNNQWITATIPIADLYYTYARGYADMIGIEVQYYHDDANPFYLDVLVDKIWGSNEYPTPTPGPTPPTPPTPPEPTPEWWINSPNESPINVDGWEPCLGTYGWNGYYELTTNHEGTYETGVDVPEVYEASDITSIRIPLVDANGDETTYHLRFVFPEDYLGPNLEDYLGLALYNGDTLVEDWSLSESSYFEAGYHYYFCAGADTMNYVDYTQGRDPSLKHDIIYAFLIIVGESYGGMECVGYYGNAIDMSLLSSRGLYLKSSWTNNSNDTNS